MPLSKIRPIRSYVLRQGRLTKHQAEGIELLSSFYAISFTNKTLNWNDIFEQKGYDSLEHLLHMDPQDVLELKRLTKMKDGHFARFQATIKTWRLPATPSTASKCSYNSHECGPSRNGTSGNGRSRNGSKSSGCLDHKCIVPKSVIAEGVHKLDPGPPSFFELFDPSRRIGDAEQQEKW